MVELMPFLQGWCLSRKTPVSACLAGRHILKKLGPETDLQVPQVRLGATAGRHGRTLGSDQRRREPLLRNRHAGRVPPKLGQACFFPIPISRFTVTP